MTRRNPPIVEKGNHKIKLSENMPYKDLLLLFGSDTYQSAWVEEVKPAGNKKVNTSSGTTQNATDSKEGSTKK